jgi:hypothetical protein
MKDNFYPIIGNKVKIKSMKWYIENNVDGVVPCYFSFVMQMRRFCGKTFKIINVDGEDITLDFIHPEDARYDDKYYVRLRDFKPITWYSFSEDMFDDIVQKRSIRI